MPKVGQHYDIVEWDGTKDVVEVLMANESEVKIRYRDGVAHIVSVAYFEKGLAASEITQ